MNSDTRPPLPVLPDHHDGPEHTVQFYESDDFLHDTVARFLAEGFAGGQPALVIATDAHNAGFTELLMSRGFDAKHALESGQLTVLRASDVLSRIMDGSMPDRDLFRKHVGARLDACPLSGPRGMRAFGEMVDVLWRGGNPRGAIRLEELWNELARTHRFQLLCAYPIVNFASESQAQQFDEVCRLHGRVFPTESFRRDRRDNSSLREITQLQQRARALETEVKRRGRLEQALRESLEREKNARE